MVGNLRLSPFEVLLRMCPLAAVQSLLCAYFSDELKVVGYSLPYELSSRTTLNLVVANGLLAFGQNVSSFYTNKIAGALTIAVCANLKQLSTIILAIRIFNTKVTPLSAFGIIFVLSGTMYYSWTVVNGTSEGQMGIKTAISHSRNASLEEKGEKH